ncbi:MAG TPA: helix-turn-helix domain-containing protein [Pseudonocardia sp.]
MTGSVAAAGVPLDELVVGAGALAEVRGVPAAGPPRVTGVAILDPDDEFGDHHGELVLVIGVRGRAAVPFLRAAARSGAVAVAVKAGAAELDEVVAAAVDAGVALLVVLPGVRWDQLGGLLRDGLETAEVVRGGPGAPAGAEDLYALAETTALLTGGIVSIEDTGNRVLAYSRSEDDIDELRRLSILGWQGPETYMAMLRRWGVLDRLRDRDRVVRVDEHPDLGIRARLAVGVHAGTRRLGTIWVQQRSGGHPFTERAGDALLGAARLAATEILRRRAGLGSASDPREELARLLSGRANTDLAAGRLGWDPEASALVIGFGAPLEGDAADRQLRREQVRGVVSVYAIAYHRGALVAEWGERVYAVLSGVPVRADGVRPGWVSDAVAAVRARTGQGWRAGIAAPVAVLAGLAAGRAEADRVLDALARGTARGGRRAPGPAVATISELRAEVLLGEVLDVLARRPELGHPGVARLVEHDVDSGGELVDSLLAHLDALGDVRAAADVLHVHPNTLRHRLRRARAVSGVALDDPGERLACHLELLLVTRSRPRRDGGPGGPRRGRLAAPSDDPAR